MATSPRTTPTRKTPAKAIAFSVAKAEKEVADGRRPDPFVVELQDGETVTFLDPVLLGWLTTTGLSTEDPVHMVKTLLSEEDYKTFVASPVSSGALLALAESLRDWYGLLDSGN